MTLERMTKTATKIRAITLAAKPWLVLLSLLGGLFVEFTMQYLIDNYHWTISQPLSSALYSALCVSLFFLFGRTYSKRIAALSILSGIYGFLLLITLNGACYTLLNGIIWHNSINFQLVYRLFEVIIVARTLWDARVNIESFCHTIFNRGRFNDRSNKNSIYGVY